MAIIAPDISHIPADRPVIARMNIGLGRPGVRRVVPAATRSTRAWGGCPFGRPVEPRLSSGERNSGALKAAIVNAMAPPCTYSHAMQQRWLTDVERVTFIDRQLGTLVDSTERTRADFI